MNNIKFSPKALLVISVIVFVALFHNGYAQTGIVPENGSYKAVDTSKNKMSIDTSKTVKKKKKKASAIVNTGPVSKHDSIPANSTGSQVTARKDSMNAPPDISKRRKKIRDKGDDLILSNGQSVDVRNIRKKEAPVLTDEQAAEMLLDTGNYYLEKLKYKKALNYFDSIVMYHQSAFQYRLAFYFKAKCKMGLNDNESALTDFEYFMQLDNCKSNFCTDAHYSMGILKFKAGDVIEAMNEFETAEDDSTYKNHKFCYFYMAFCFAQKEDYIHAVQNLTTYLSFDKQRSYSSAEALYYRGYYKAQLKDNRGAIKDYDDAIQLYQAAVDAHNLQYVQKLIDTYIVRGLAKNELKRYDEAIADYDIVLKMNVKYAPAYRLKGLAEIGKGLTDVGCLDLSRAGELGSDEAYDDIKAHCK